MLRTLAAVLLSIATCAHADRVVTTDQGDEIPVRIYAGHDDRLILWLSSEFGTTPRRVALAEALAAHGTEVWAPDLHAAWFLPVGRYSLNSVDPAAVSALVDEAATAGKKIYLMADGRTTALALAAVRQWQTVSDDTAPLRGLIAFSPKLFVSTPQGGEEADYLPIVAASNMPIYLLQPQESSGVWRVEGNAGELEKGGSSVFVHILPGVSDGFHARPDHTPAEQAMAERLPALLADAMAMLDLYGGTPVDAAVMRSAAIKPEQHQGGELLRPYAAERFAPTLALPTLKGGPVDLAALKNKVVLVNFWATWCPPCVEEIPSLQRLYDQLRPEGLEILAVDVGETRQALSGFLKDKPVDFPIAMDEDGAALKRWRVYAFPTTLVLDRDHRIRYAVFGAFDWSSQEVIETLRPLLDAKG